MGSYSQQGYLARHKRIRNKLLETVRSSGRACVEVSHLSSDLKMDIRTVRAHLDIMETDAAGVFMDSTKKQFCTKEGIALLANALKLSGDDIG